MLNQLFCIVNPEIELFIETTLFFFYKIILVDLASTVLLNLVKTEKIMTYLFILYNLLLRLYGFISNVVK